MKRKLLLKILLAILCFSSFSTVLFLSMRYIYQKQEKLILIQHEAQQETKSAAQKINQFITMLNSFVDKLIQKMRNKELTHQEIIELLSQKPTTISGVGICFADKKYAPYYVENNGEQKLIQLEKTIDYTKPEHHWYHLPLTTKAQLIEAPLWLLPEHVLIGYAAPFYKDNKLSGVIFAHQTAEHIKHILTTIYLGKTGYWFILSPDETVLVHPYDKHSDERNKLPEIISSEKEPVIHNMIKQLPLQRSGFIHYHNEIDGESSWLFFEPIPSTSWILCRVFPYSEIPLDKDQLRQTIMLLSLSILIFLTFLTLFIFSFLPITVIRLWIISFTISALLLSELIALWYVIWHMPSYQENLIPIRDKVSLYAFLDTIPKEHVNHDKQKLHSKTTNSIEMISKEIRHTPKLNKTIQHILEYRYKYQGYIPTGIYVQHLKLIAENQLEMTAYIWQRYFDKIHDNISRGFTLPQAAVTKINQVYNEKEFDTETIIWQVRATINQRILYIKYPFDIKDFQIQIAHKDFAQNITLVPDLVSYKLIHPTSLPGLNKEIYLPGWRIVNSYFGYKITDYNTSFGLYSYGPLGIYKEVEKCNQPNLYFNITGQRFLINTLVANLLPLSVIALLLFVTLLTSAMQGYATLGSCASVFFGTVFAQQFFRGKIESYNLVYFETFYLVMYAAMIAIVIISLLYALKMKIPIIQYKQNLVAKLIYWPIVLSALLIITFRYFY